MCNQKKHKKEISYSDLNDLQDTELILKKLLILLIIFHIFIAIASIIYDNSYDVVTPFVILIILKIITYKIGLKYHYVPILMAYGVFGLITMILVIGATSFAVYYTLLNWDQVPQLTSSIIFILTTTGLMLFVFFMLHVFSIAYAFRLVRLIKHERRFNIELGLSNNKMFNKNEYCEKQ